MFKSGNITGHRSYKILNDPVIRPRYRNYIIVDTCFADAAHPAIIKKCVICFGVNKVDCHACGKCYECVQRLNQRLSDISASKDKHNFSHQEKRGRHCEIRLINCERQNHKETPADKAKTVFQREIYSKNCKQHCKVILRCREHEHVAAHD